MHANDILAPMVDMANFEKVSQITVQKFPSFCSFDIIHKDWSLSNSMDTRFTNTHANFISKLISQNITYVNRPWIRELFNKPKPLHIKIPYTTIVI